MFWLAETPSMFHRGSIALAYTVVPRTSARVRSPCFASTYCWRFPSVTFDMHLVQSLPALPLCALILRLRWSAADGSGAHCIGTFTLTFSPGPPEFTSLGSAVLKLESACLPCALLFVFAQLSASAPHFLPSGETALMADRSVDEGEEPRKAENGQRLR